MATITLIFHHLESCCVEAHIYHTVSFLSVISTLHLQIMSTIGTWPSYGSTQIWTWKPRGQKGDEVFEVRSLRILFTSRRLDVRRRSKNQYHWHLSPSRPYP